MDDFLEDLTNLAYIVEVTEEHKIMTFKSSMPNEIKVHLVSCDSLSECAKTAENIINLFKRQNKIPVDAYQPDKEKSNSQSKSNADKSGNKKQDHTKDRVNLHNENDELQQSQDEACYQHSLDERSQNTQTNQGNDSSQRNNNYRGRFQNQRGYRGGRGRGNRGQQNQYGNRSQNRDPENNRQWRQQDNSSGDYNQSNRGGTRNENYGNNNNNRGYNNSRGGNRRNIESRGRGRNIQSSERPSPSFDPNKYCEVCDNYTFDIKYLKGEKLKLSDALSRLYIEEKGKIDEVIPLSFLMHTTTPGTHAQLMFPAQSLYAHKAVTRKAVKTKKQEKLIPDSSGQLTPIPAKQDKKIAKIPSNKGAKCIPQTKSKQVVTTNVKEIRRATHEQLINEQKAATNDTSINTDLVQTIKVPSLEIVQAPKPLLMNDKAVTIYDKHIPKQEEIDKILQNLRTKVLRNINININAQDLIREYDKSPRFKEVYAYILRSKLTANAIMHKKVVLDASNFVIVNGFLLKLEKFKNASKFDYRVLLCIPESFENAIFHMYHNSLTAFHQGHWKTFLTMKEIFYIPNMLNKLRNYINACTDCLKYKSKPYGQSLVQYGYMPKDYIPMESFACDIKYMPPVFGGYKFILMVTCEQTNFVIAVPMTDRTATHIAEAIITCVLSISGPPSFLSVDADQALTGNVIKILLESIECEMQIISPYNHGSSKAERQIKTISEMIVKKLNEKGDRWPLYAAIAAYAMNTYASDVLQGLTPFELVFIRKPRVLLGYKFKPLDEYPVTIRHYRTEQISYEVSKWIGK